MKWILLGLFIFSISGQAKTNRTGAEETQAIREDAVTKAISPNIVRTIDASKTLRPFPQLLAYRNTSLQKTPPPVLGKLSEELFGRPQMTRCWLNLDELWDYRTRSFDFDFKIGVDKYKDIPEKHRETWNSQVQSPITYYAYLKAFSDHSETIMLTIRRYERDIMDGKLPVTLADWKMILKTGLKHYKTRFPNIRYVEVGNEYELKQFMGATDDEYYQFYQAGYEAVHEINEELQLEGSDRILVGGPVVTNSPFKRINRFFELYNQDQSPVKRIDFVSWHEYHQPYYKTAFREYDAKALLTANGLPETTPMFISEHNAYHFSEDQLEYHHLNAAGIVKSMYFASLYSPNLKLVPWIQYHNSGIQTRFIWFDGPNGPETKASELKMLPLGCSMKFLSMHAEREVLVDNSLAKEELVLVSSEKNRLVAEVINYAEDRDVVLKIGNLSDVFPEPGNSKVRLTKYLIDSKHSNSLTNPDYPGGIEKVDEQWVEISSGNLTLEHRGLEKDGLVLWEIRQ